MAGINDRPFKKMPGSRRQLFEELDRPALRPLPASRYEFATWRTASRSTSTTTSRLDRHYYSVPYQLVGQLVDVRVTATTVEVFCSARAGGLPPAQLRAGRPHHRPRPHARVPPPPRRSGRRHGSSPGPRRPARPPPRSPRRSWRPGPIPSRAIAPALGIIRLADRYGAERLEAACARALAVRAFSYRSVESILRHGLDRQPLPASPTPCPPPRTTTCAARATTDERTPPCSTTPPSTDSHALRLPAMARGLLEQREHPDYDSLGFEERLGMLVDRELTERQNRRLAADAEGRPAAHRRRGRGHRLPPAPGPGPLPGAVAWPSRTGSSPHHARGHRRRRPGWARPTWPARWPTPPSAAGHRALYLRAPRLLDELAIARADGRLPRLMATWARVDVLVIDDFLLRPLAPDQAADLLEVIEDRVGLRSTIVTSQLPVAMWHEASASPTVADAILDRLLEHVHRIELHGESMRRKRRRPQTTRRSRDHRPHHGPHGQRQPQWEPVTLRQTALVPTPDSCPQADHHRRR